MSTTDSTGSGDMKRRHEDDAASKRPKIGHDEFKEKLAEKKAQEEKIRLRRERLASWRKKMEKMEKLKKSQDEDKQQDESKEAAATSGGNGAAAMPKVSLVNKARTKASSNAMFADEEEEEKKAKTKLGVSADILAQFKKAKQQRKASTEDDEDEDDTGAAHDDDDNDGVDADPLDAYMQSVDHEVTKIKQQDAVRIRNRKMLGILGKSKRGEKISDADAGFDYPSSEDEVEEVAGQPKYWSGYTPKQPRELGVPDHSKIDYEDFRKTFYKEVPEIERMADQEVAQLRFELENIKTRGKDCPRPIKAWNQSGLSRRVLDILKALKYDKPTPIQAQALPVIMSGRDMLGIAKTGSGKTLAFLLPMLRHVLDQRRVQQGEGCIALILSPTRELAMQTYTEAKKFTKHLDLRIACVYGGSDIADQIAHLKRAVEIIVCTPGRMIDMLTVNRGKVTNPRRITYVVLDEADRMFDMGFEPQVMRILDNIRPDRQTVMFSATFPRAMEVLARKILKRPVEIQVGGRSVVSDTVEQHVLVMQEQDKFNKLLELLGHYYTQGNVIVFVHRQEKADMLLSNLISNGYMALPLHGAVSQEDRQSNIRDFKLGNVKILIATSVAARGLDVKSLKLVVNYDCPNHYEDYVHRCGRTGRAGNKGTAFTLLTAKDDRQHAGHVIKALELSEQKPPQELVDMWDAYKKEAKAKGKRIGGGSGFRGRGYKFSAEELIRRKQKKLLALKAHSEGNLDADYKEREQELAEEIETQVDMLMGRKPKALREEEGEEGAEGAEGGESGEGAEGGAAKKGDATAGKAAAEGEGGAQAHEVQARKMMVSAPLLGASPEDAAIAAAAAATSTSAAAAAGGGAAVTGASVAGAATKAAEGEGAQGGKAMDPMTKMAEALKRAQAVSAKYGFKSRAEADAQAKKKLLQQQQQQQQEERQARGHFEEEIEVNDWPQQARWKVTRKEFMQEVAETCGAAITVRGTYFPGGKKPKGMEQERPIYICIEGRDEQSVARAIALCRQVLKEELHSAATTFQPQARQQQPGRYRVLALTGGK